jgi:hypothetical protein
MTGLAPAIADQNSKIEKPEEAGNIHEMGGGFNWTDEACSR